MENSEIIRMYTVENRTFDYDPSVPCIISTGLGFMRSHEFRSSMERGLELISEKITEHGKLGWLADARRVEVFEPQDMEWVARHWNPKAYKAGIRYMAFVMPENVFAEINITEYTALTTEVAAIIVSHFSNQELAKEWLRKSMT